MAAFKENVCSCGWRVVTAKPRQDLTVSRASEKAELQPRQISYTVKNLKS